jgi:hypothetical protein
MLLSAKAPTTWVMLMTGHLPGEDVDEALRRGARTFDENPEGAAWQAFSYDGVLTQDGEQLDAVMVIARAYGERPLMMKVAFPYRPPQDGRRFAILQPALREANVGNDKIVRLQGAIDRGIEGIKWAFGTTWNELREGADAKPLAAAVPAVSTATATAAAKPVARPVPSVSPNAGGASSHPDAWRMW